MDRRKALKALVVGTAAGSLVLGACNTADKKKDAATAPEADDDRMAEEKEHNKALQEETFFTPHEGATVAVLTDIIIPKDEKSGSATDAGVPAFIDFMMRDRPELQTPMRGGLRWLDMTALKTYGAAFKDCAAREQLELVTKIAYPKKAAPELRQGATFFSLMRNLTVSGFYTTEMGFKDLGFAGNTPNQWNGVPEDVLQQYNIAYSEKELRECITYNKS